MQQAPAVTEDVIAQYISDREARTNYLLAHGETFWLPVSLAIGSSPAAGTQFQFSTPTQDFDLLIVDAWSSLRLSTIDIKDSARNRLLTNGPVQLAAIAGFTTATATYTTSRNTGWIRPYLLPARATINLNVTADGTESTGNWAFICLQPPVYNS